jgi:hypothetical protein
MKTEYPSHAEFRERNQPAVSLVTSQIEYVEFDAPSTSPICYLNVVGASVSVRRAGKARTDKENQPAKLLLTDHLAFLGAAARNERSGVKQIYDDLGWGVSKGSKVLTELRTKGLVTIHSVGGANPKGGRPRCVVKLTEQGKEWLQASESRP